MANDSHTAIYGHLKLSSASPKETDSVKTGDFLANLGNAFSSETGGERKHLHFGIYNGKGEYFKGYESSNQAIQSRWVDPGSYLKEKGARDISQQTSDVSNKNENSNPNTSIGNKNIVDPSAQTVQPNQNQNLIAEPKEKGFISNVLRSIKNLIENLFN
jgi:murein DD-endopeptidase MepM/ murein hydrolase activator NlpD